MPLSTLRGGEGESKKRFRRENGFGAKLLTELPILVVLTLDPLSELFLSFSVQFHCLS